MDTEAKVDRRIVKSREAINKAFMELFLAKPFEQITIHDIADKANVNRGTVYLHYSDKYDLLDKSIDARISELLTFCNLHDIGSELISQTPVFNRIFSYFEEHFPFFDRLFAGQRSFVFRDRLLAFLADSVERKLNAKSESAPSDNEIKAQFLASSFTGFVEWWIRRRMPHPPSHMAERLTVLFEKNEL
ncbi:MAG: TetR family transcriptional regulator [Paenibacillus sp.]|jgi:AcrR family transcriptional regulator|nr:TetR family transcriptional regulator [Paenibacillus sp.]